VTDHRIHFTAHNLAEILNGDLDDLIGALRPARDDERRSRDTETASREGVEGVRPRDA
jgi:protein subunit release factor A